MAIALRGALNNFTGTSNNGGNVTLTFDTITPPLEDDIVVVFGGHGVGTTTLSAPVGNTSGAYQQIGIHTGSAPIFGMWYQRMGATPDTSVLCSGGGNNADAGDYGCYVLSGVDTTTALDATATTAGPTTSANPNAPSITTVNANSWVIACAGSDIFDTSPGTISGYSNQLSASRNETNDLSIAAATFLNVGADAEDPAAWDTWGSATWYAITAAFRALDENVTRVPGVVDPGLDLTGKVPAFDRGFPQTKRSVVLAGQAPTLDITYAPPVLSPGLDLTGKVPIVKRDDFITVPYVELRLVVVRGLTLSGHPPTVVVSADLSPTIEVPAGSLTLAGKTPIVLDLLVPIPEVVSFTINEQIPLRIVNYIRGPPVLDPGLDLVGKAPSLDSGALPPARALSLAGQAPSIDITYAPASRALLLNEKLPVVGTGYVPASRAFVLDGKEPSLDLTIPVPERALLLNEKIPLRFVGTLSQPGVVDPGLDLTGKQPSLDLTIPVPERALLLDGKQPQIGFGYVPDSRALLLDEKQPQIGFGYVPSSRAFILDGKEPFLATAYEMPVRALVLSGKAPAALTGLSPPAGSLTLDGKAPSLDLGISPASRAFVLDGKAPSLDSGSLPPARALTLSGKVSSLDLTIPAAAGALVLDGKAPSLGGIEPAAATLTLTGYAPTIPTAAATPAAATLVLTGHTPIRAFGLKLTGHAPIVNNGPVFTPPRALLKFRGHGLFIAPELPPAGALTLTGYAPTRPVGLLLRGYAPVLVSAEKIPDSVPWFVVSDRLRAIVRC
jgi:hypothetical protein